MREKRYRVRVEVATVLEFDVDAVHEDEAAAVGESLVFDLLPEECRSWNVRTVEVIEEVRRV